MAVRWIDEGIGAGGDAGVVGTASNGVGAIQQASELKPDLVIRDPVMRDIDGMAALRMLQSEPPELGVAMLSSAGGAAFKAEETFRLGAAQVLSKPADEEILAATLSQERERSRSHARS